MQQGNLKLHFSPFLCLIWFCARKGDFLPFPFYLHLLQFLYIGLVIHFTLFLRTLSCLATRHSFKNFGIQIPFCSACFLSSPAAADWHCMACPPIQAAKHREFAQLSFTVSVHKFLPFSFAISISSPHNYRWQAPKLLASVLRCSSWENYFIQTHGQEQPAVLHARYIRWPLFLEEYHTAYGSVRVAV